MGSYVAWLRDVVKIYIQIEVGEALSRAGFESPNVPPIFDLKKHTH
jgi:hypothetical protein